MPSLFIPLHGTHDGSLDLENIILLPLVMYKVSAISARGHTPEPQQHCGNSDGSSGARPAMRTSMASREQRMTKWDSPLLLLWIVPRREG